MMRAFRLFALVATTLTVSWLSAETVPDPTKRPGAGPLFRIRRGDKWGYMSPTGRFLIRPQFDYERDFFHGLAGVFVQEKWGFVDVHGAFAIRPQFDDVRDFLDDL